MHPIKEEKEPNEDGRWSDGSVSDTQTSEMVAGTDCVDALPENLSFSAIDLCILIVCIISYMFDIGTDIVLARSFYITNYMTYFGLTVTFILLPAIVMAGFSLKWYISDKAAAEEDGKQKTLSITWVLRIIGVCFHLGPVMRYLTSIYYGLKFRKSKQSKVLFHMMINEDADAALLRLFECFLESGPQLILQIYILAVETSLQDGHWLFTTLQVLSILSSLFSMAWSLVSYHRSLRMSLPSKTNISCLGSFIQLLWNLFTISARVIALALFASLQPVWFVVFCVAHWGVMTLWIISMKTEFCEKRWTEIIYNAVLGIIYIFCYFNAVDSRTRYRYIAYYSITFVENTVFIVVWYFMCNPVLWYRHAAIATQITAFFIGIVFMIVYYLLLHPMGNIAVKICSNNDHCRSDHSFGNGNNVKRLGRLDSVNSSPGRPVMTQFGMLNSPLTNPDSNEPNGNNNVKSSIETAV